MTHVERYRYGSHPEGDFRPLLVSVVAKRVRRFVKVHNEQIKAMTAARNKAAQEAKAKRHGKLR